MINISIVLFNNQEGQVNKLLDDLLLQGNLIKHIYLVDNSIHTALSTFAHKHKKIIYIHSKRNLGYGSAHNIAIQKSIDENVKYHVVINPDIRLEQNVLFELMKYLDENSNVGLAMPDIRYPDGSRQHLCKLLPHPIALFSRRFLPRTISHKFDRKYNLLDIDYSKEMNVPLLSGCFMFLRTSVLADVGVFDSRFFMYLEDFDLVRRIHTKYSTIFLPSVQVVHEYAKGSYKNRKLMVYHVKSAIKYFNKWGWLFDFSRKKINNHFLKTYGYRCK